jgi:hypothetical protein
MNAEDGEASSEAGSFFDHFLLHVRDEQYVISDQQYAKILIFRLTFAFTLLNSLAQVVSGEKRSKTSVIEFQISTVNK